MRIKNPQTLQIKPGNILAPLHCFKNICQVGGILLSQALQQAFRAGNMRQICLQSFFIQSNGKLKQQQQHLSMTAYLDFWEVVGLKQVADVPRFTIYLHFSRQCIPTINAHTGANTRSFLSSPLHVGPQEESSLLSKCFHISLLVVEHPHTTQLSLKFFVIFPVGNGCLFQTNSCLESLVDGERKLFGHMHRLQLAVQRVYFNCRPFYIYLH